MIKATLLTRCKSIRGAAIRTDYYRPRFRKFRQKGNDPGRCQGRLHDTYCLAHDGVSDKGEYEVVSAKRVNIVLCQPKQHQPVAAHADINIEQGTGSGRIDIQIPKA